MALTKCAVPTKPPLFVTRSPYLVGPPKAKPAHPAPPKRAHSYGGFDYQSCLDEFEVIGPIAKGAFSLVLRARRVADEREQVAIKCFNLKRMVDSPDEHRAMQRELAALHALSHPNVMRLHTSVEGDNAVFAIMEYLGGSSLKYELNKRTVAFPEPVVQSILAQLASALAHVHERGYIHRDLKAANVLFSDASRTQVKLVDFGFAMPIAEGSSTRVLPKCGTPTHMAPELHLFRSYDGRRADVWALGVLSYELLHRSLPFDAPNLEALKIRIMKGHRAASAKTLSLGARALVHQMLTVDPAERPDAAQVCAHPWLTSTPQGQEPAGPSPE